jgi:hypothetical protein
MQLKISIELWDAQGDLTLQTGVFFNFKTLEELQRYRQDGAPPANVTPTNSLNLLLDGVETWVAQR